MTITSNVRDELQLSDVSQRGLRIYDTVLKAGLEPALNGQIVAIDVESGNHVVADSSPAAMRRLREQRPGATVFLRMIGPEQRHGLVARVRAAPPPPDTSG